MLKMSGVYYNSVSLLCRKKQIKKRQKMKTTTKQMWVLGGIILSSLGGFFLGNTQRERSETVHMATMREIVVTKKTLSPVTANSYLPTIYFVENGKGSFFYTSDSVFNLLRAGDTLKMLFERIK